MTEEERRRLALQNYRLSSPLQVAAPTSVPRVTVAPPPTNPRPLGPVQVAAPQNLRIAGTNTVIGPQSTYAYVPQPRRNVVDRVRDVFDANSPMDIYLRKQKGQVVNNRSGNPYRIENPGNIITRTGTEIREIAQATARNVGGVVGPWLAGSQQQTTRDKVNQDLQELLSQPLIERQRRARDPGYRMGLQRAGLNPDNLTDDSIRSAIGKSSQRVDKSTYKPANNVSKFVLGNTEVQNIPLRVAGTRKALEDGSLGEAGKKTAAILAPAGVALAVGLDLIPGGSARTRFAKQLAKTDDPVEVLEILYKNRQALKLNEDAEALAGLAVNIASTPKAARVEKLLTGAMRTGDEVAEVAQTTEQLAEIARRQDIERRTAATNAANVVGETAETVIPNRAIGAEITTGRVTLTQAYQELKKTGFNDQEISDIIADTPEITVVGNKGVEANKLWNNARIYEERRLAAQQQVSETVQKNVPEPRPASADEAVQEAIEQAPPSATPSAANEAVAAADEAAFNPETAMPTSSATTDVPGTTPPTGIDNTVNAADPFNNDSMLGRLRNELGMAFVDEDAPLINLLKRLERESGRTDLVDRFLFDTNTQRASNSIANSKVYYSTNLRAAVNGLDEAGIDAFDDYAAARAELSNLTDRGLERSSKEMSELQRIVNEGGADFDQRYQALNGYYKEWADDLLDAGIITPERHAEFVADGNYIRVQRDMEDLANQSYGGSRSRSFGSTTATQKRTGSEREVLSPTRTAVERAQQLQLEIQRNRTATNLINTLEESGLATKIPTSDTARKNVIKRFVNGQVEAYEIPRDIKEIVDNVQPYQLGILQKIIAFPARVFRAGTTALSAPFTVTNYVRDQATSAINSKNFFATHSVENIAEGIWQATKDFGGVKNDDLWRKFISYAGDQTVFDQTRNVAATKKVLRELRLGGKGKAINMASQPIRTVEDMVGITEKATRFQNFKGIYEDALKKGLSEDEAIEQAVLAAYNNSVNFMRAGRYGRAFNLLVPYFNAAIQGSRTTLRTAKTRPLATAIKAGTFVATPLVALTIYNTADEERRKVYEQIPDYVKEDNLVIVVGGKAHLIPMPQGYREAVTPLRRTTERFTMDNPIDALQIAEDIVNSASGPLELDINNPEKVVTNNIPQALKPLVQQVANKDFFTGNDIVPEYINDATDENGNPVPESEKATKYTSGTARYIADILGVSPIRVEKFVNDTFGSVGRYGINATDNLLAKAGKIPDEQIGGKSIADDFKRRLIYDTEQFKKTDSQLAFEDRKTAVQGLNKNELDAFNSIFPSRKNFKGDELTEKTYFDSLDKAATYLRYPKVFEAAQRWDAEQRKRGIEGDPLYDLPPDRQKIMLNLMAYAGTKEADAVRKLNPWVNDFYKQRSAYFDNVKAKLTPEQQAKWGIDPMGLKIVTPTPTVQAKLNQLNQIKDPAQRGKFYADNPDITEYYRQKDLYDRAKRAFMGRPQYDAYPQKSKEVEQYEKTYFGIPEGGGSRGGNKYRSEWIKSHPKEWAAMTNYWNAKNLYDLQEEMALSVYEGIDLSEDGAKNIQQLAKALGGEGGGGGGSGGFGGNYKGRKYFVDKDGNVTLEDPTRKKMYVSELLEGKKTSLKVPEFEGTQPRKAKLKIAVPKKTGRRKVLKLQ